MKKKSMDWYKQQQRFSVRKYHFGAASVLLGTALVFGGAQASADEVTAPATPSTESTTATSAETTAASEGAPAVLTASEATPASLTASEASSSTEATSLDKGALQVALSQAKALDLSNKTSETVAILLAQIEHAQTVLNTATSQEELNQAVADLQAAQAQLADKPAEASKPAVASTEAAQPATTPASVIPATPASSETSSQPSEKATSEAAQPSHGRRSRRDLSAVTPTATTPAAAASTVVVTKDNLQDYFGFNGTTTYDQNSNWVTLVPDTINSQGNIYLKTKIDTDESFQLKSSIIRHNPNSGEHIADGLTFVFTPKSQGTLGYDGMSLGIGGLPDSFGFTLSNTQHGAYGANPLPRDSYHPVADPSTNPNFGSDSWGGVIFTNDGGYMLTDVPKAQPITTMTSPDGEPYNVEYNGSTKHFMVQYQGKSWDYDLTNYLNSIQAKYGSTDVSLSIAASTGSSRGNFGIKIDEFRFGAAGFGRVNYVNQTTGNQISQPNDVQGLKNEVKDVRTSANATNTIVTTNGYTLVSMDTSKAPTYNVSAGTVTLTRDNQFITYTYKDTQAPTVTHTSDVSTGARKPMTPVVVNFADNSDNELDATGNKVVTTTSSVSGLPTGVSYNPATRTLSGTPTTAGNYTPTLTVTDAAGNSSTDTFNFVVTPQSDEFTPAGQDVPTKHGETPNAADGIANKGDLPADTKYDWKTPVDTSTPGDKPGTVVVTYPDGTKDEVPVTVKVKPQSDEFTPNGQDVPAKHGETPNAADGIANKGDLPDGTKYDWKTPVDTTTPGDKPGTVVVTYPDGTKDEVPVTVHVGSQSDLYNPDGQNLNVKQGDQPEASKGIANRGNLPEGTTYDWKTPVDTSTVGDKPATVVVTYPDGSKDEVPVTVKVTEKLHVKTPADKVPVKDPSHLTPDDINKVVENIKKENPGLPDDAKITVNPNGGDTTIETKDGDKVTIPGSDLVRPETDADKNNVKVPADKVPVKDPSNLTDAEKDKVKDNIKKANPDLPNGTKIDVAKDGTATITFPDGSTKVIPGSDLVRPETDADKNNVKVPADKVPVKDPSNLTDAEKDKVKDNIKKANPDLPNGTKIDVAKDGTATITFPDGSTKVIPGSDLVRPETDADRHTPKGQDVPVKQGETPKAEDGIANKGDLPNGTKIEWKETPDTSKVGDHNATIVITYPDGSKDEVTVTVKVSPNANNNGHNGNNGSQGNGNSGSHNNGTNGDQGQGDKDKKDQAGKDTNNGLDKLFSNSGNGSASGNQSGASRKQAPALPNTGDASNPAMALAFAALLGGTALVMKKRKKEEEE
mgnify:CR=1 FL=1